MKTRSRILIDGREDESLLKISLRALKQGSNEIPLVACTPLDPTSQLYHGIDEVYQIPALKGVREYSMWFLQNASRYVLTDYAEFVQHDGFVVNQHKFEEAFLDYDYIGAPWPLWPQNKGYRVGNGGFSIRSKKFLEVCAEMDFTKAESDAEDFIVCVEFREQMEKAGLTFAPLEVAARFSVENVIPEYDTSYPTYGFHGKVIGLTQKYCEYVDY